MIKVIQPLGLPRLLDEAIDETRKGDHGLLWTVAVGLALLSGLYSSLSTLYVGALDSGLGCGALILTFALLPVVFAATVAGYSLLGLSAARRVFGQDLPVRRTIRQALEPRVLLTVAFTVLLLIASAAFFLLPVIVTSALFSLLFPVMVIEGRYGTEAIRRSSELVWRNPRGLLRTAPVLVVLTIHGVFVAISTLLGLAIQLPYQVLTQGAIWRASLGGDEAAAFDSFFGLVWIQIPTSVLSTLVSTVAASYLFHALALYYRDLRERREALSLESAVTEWERSTLGPTVTEVTGATVASQQSPDTGAT